MLHFQIDETLNICGGRMVFDILLNVLKTTVEKEVDEVFGHKGFRQEFEVIFDI